MVQAERKIRNTGKVAVKPASVSYDKIKTLDELADIVQ